MKRYPNLVALTHDHHHALAQARRMNAVALSGDSQARLAQARDFLDFFNRETLLHFREEEEVLFPLLVDQAVEPPLLLTQTLLEHQQIHAGVNRLRKQVNAGDVDPGALRHVAELLGGHIRREEKELFPLIERTVSEDELVAVALAGRHRQAPQPPA